MKLIPLLLAMSALVLMAFGTMQTKESEMSLGTYSISLNVEDLSKSLDFYQKLGFTPIEGAGSLEQNWMILSNGETKIGLFQDMFSSNTITFNPKDARSIHKKLLEEGIETTYESGLEKTEGPCAFSITDPDGNPILIDQH